MCRHIKRNWATMSPTQMYSDWANTETTISRPKRTLTSRQWVKYIATQIRFFVLSPFTNRLSSEHQLEFTDFVVKVNKVTTNMKWQATKSIEREMKIQQEVLYSNRAHDSAFLVLRISANSIMQTQNMAKKLSVNSLIGRVTSENFRTEEMKCHFLQHRPKISTANPVISRTMSIKAMNIIRY